MILVVLPVIIINKDETGIPVYHYNGALPGTLEWEKERLLGL